MVHINDFTDRILDEIFSHLVTGSIDRDKRQKRILLDDFTLAHVCYKWRNMLLPRLYCNAYLGIRLKDSPETIMQPTIDDLEVSSNIKLAVDNNFSHLVQNLYFFSFNLYLCDFSLINLLSRQHFGRAKWDNIYRLFVQDILSMHFGINAAPVSFDSDRVISESEYLSTHLPGLTSISFLTAGLDYPQCPLSRLINRKAPILSHLNIESSPVDFTVRSFSTALTYLKLNLSGRESVVPFIYAPSLQHLILENAPPNFSFSFLHSESRDMHICSNLQTLVLHFTYSEIFDGDFDTNFNYMTKMLRTPKLKQLTLKNMAATFPTFHPLSISLELENIELDGDIFSIRAFNTQLLNSKFITIRIKEGAHDISKAHREHFESIFSQKSVATAADISSNLTCPISINSVGWTKLKYLRLYAPIYRSSLIRLLTQLPLLKYLRISSIIPDEESVKRNESLLTTSLYSVYPLFSRHLRKLHMFGDYNYSPTNFEIATSYELIIRIPSLRKVYVPNSIYQDVQRDLGLIFARLSPTALPLKIIGFKL